MEGSTKKLLLVVCLLAASCCLSGCWDNKELKNIEVVASLGLDYTANPATGQPQKTVSVEVLKADKALEAGSKDSSRFYYGNGDSILSAIDSVYSQGAKELSWPHNRLLVLGQSVGQVSAADYLDYFIRSYEIRPTMLLAMAETSAQDLLARVDAGEITASNAILTILDKKEQGVEESFLRVTLQDFVDGLMNTGVDPILPIVETDEEGVRIQRLMAFRQGKAAGSISPQETRGVLWVKNQMEHGVITLENAGQTQALDVLASQCKLKVEPGQQPQVKLFVEVKTGLKEDSSQGQARPASQQPQQGDVTGTVTELEEAVNQAVAGDIQLAIKRSRALNSDFLGLGQAVYRHQSDLWQQLPENNYLAKLPVAVEVHSDLVFLGDTARAFGR